MRPSFVSQLFPDGNVPVLEAVLGFAHHRQTAIANNMANLETPHYRRQDIPDAPFARILRQAIEDRAELHPGRWRLDGNLGYAASQGRHPEPRTPVGKPYPEPRGDDPVRHDANNVTPEAELAALQKNTLAIRALQQLLTRAVRATHNATQFRNA